MIIYLLRCAANGKCYIGKTSRTLHKRWLEHVKEARLARLDFPLYRDIRHYGAHRFEVMTIGHAPHPRTARKAEVEAIIKHNGFPGGYNQNLTSNGGKRKKFYRRGDPLPLPDSQKRKIADSVRRSWIERRKQAA